MSKKQKHRIVVEITTSKPITEADAVRAMRLLHDRIDLEAKSIWDNALSIYAVKLTPKSFSRVISALSYRRLTNYHY